ncbi:hypothetical protein ACFL5Y_03110, partial [Candidatus Omnitrophota bacterium]
MKIGGSVSIYNNINHYLAGREQPAEGDCLHPVSLIEVQTNPRKRIWLKVISFFVAFVFLFQQIAFSADLAYLRPAPVSTHQGQIKEALFSGEDEIEVTNYDLLSYQRNEGLAGKLLPEAKEQEQTASYAPAYLKRLQSKHEELMRQKKDIENFRLRVAPTKFGRRRAGAGGFAARMPLKKKQSSGGGGGTVEYTLTSPDDADTPHVLNDFPTTPDTNQTTKFDITKMDIARWMQGATKKIDEKTGEAYWVGGTAAAPKDDRCIQVITYLGAGDNKKIKAIKLGYRMTDAGTYEAKYQIDYTYDGEDIKETRKYDVSEGPDNKLLVELSNYEGTGDDNRLKQTIYYDADDDTKITKRRDYVYSDDKELRETRFYETDSAEEGDGKLTQKTVFLGEKDKEVANYLQTIRDGEVENTTTYYYKGGKRAGDVSDQEYRYSKSKQITFKGNPDTNEDGVLSDEELENAQKISMLVYDDTHRLAGEEVVDFTLNYRTDGTVSRTTVSFYEDGKRASDANYRECLTRSTAYYGDLDEDGDGKISDGELAEATKVSETFYHTRLRLKGEEKSDYTIRYDSKGEKTSITVYEYETADGLVRAEDATAEDAMKKSTTYTADSIAEDEYDENGNLLEGEDGLVDGPTIVSETFYQGKVGEEKTDYTIKYKSNGDETSITIYWYESADALVRAKDAAVKDAMKKSTTYTADSISEDEYDENGNLLEGEDGLVDDPTIVSETFYEGNVGEEKSDYTIKYTADGENASITIYEYEGGLGGTLQRANEATAEDAMKKSTTYTADSIADGEYDGDGNLLEGQDGLINDPTIVSETFYVGIVGEEKSDYTLKYNSEGEKTSITIYEYEGGPGGTLRRAKDATPEDAMKKSTTYTASSIAEGEYKDDGTLEEGENGLIDRPIKVSETFYEGKVGEEKSDYTLKYDSRGEKTSITIYWYEGPTDTLQRAKDATPEDAMKKSTTYTASSIDKDEYDENGSLSEDKDGLVDGPTIVSETFYEGNVGEEKSDYTIKYKSNGDRTSITIYWYDRAGALVRAREATAENAMRKSTAYTAGSIEEEEYDENGSLLEGEDGLENDPAERVKTSETFYEGNVGEEKSDYTIQYNSKEEKTAITIYEYEGAAGLVRAKDAAAEAAMKKSTTYTKDSIAGAEYDATDGTLNEGKDGLNDDPTKVVKKSETFYEGNVGEEKSDRTINYRTDGIAVRTTTYYFYEHFVDEAPGQDLDGDGITGEENVRLEVRAALAFVNDAMSRSDTYKGDHEADPDTKLQSQTVYYTAHGAGYEIADYTYNYGSDGTSVRTVGVFYYEGGVRASAASTDDSLVRQDTHRTDDITKIEVSNRKSSTLFDIHLGKGEEITDYTLNYKSDGVNVSTTTVYFYQATHERATAADSDDAMTASAT